MTRSPLTANLWVGLLVVSVLFNGVLGGVLIQRALSGPQIAAPAHDGHPAARGRFNPHAFLMALPEEVRPAARQALREGAGEMRPLMHEAMQARRAAHDTLAAEPFDSAAALAALARVRAARDAMEAHGEAVVLDIAARLDPQTRRRVLREAWSGRPPFGAPHDNRGEPAHGAMHDGR